MTTVRDKIDAGQLRETLVRIQHRLKQYVPAGMSLSEELISNRRVAADSE